MERPGRATHRTWPWENKTVSRDHTQTSPRDKTLPSERLHLLAGFGSVGILVLAAAIRRVAGRAPRPLPRRTSLTSLLPALRHTASLSPRAAQTGDSSARRPVPAEERCSRALPQPSAGPARAAQRGGTDFQTFRTSLHTLMQGLGREAPSSSAFVRKSSGTVSTPMGHRSGMGMPGNIASCLPSRSSTSSSTSSTQIPHPFRSGSNTYAPARYGSLIARRWTKSFSIQKTWDLESLRIGNRLRRDHKPAFANIPKPANEYDSDSIALLQEYKLCDKIDDLADSGVCSSMDLHRMFEIDVQQVRRDLKLPYSFNAM